MLACVSCKVFMRPAKVGAEIVEMTEGHEGTVIPYQLWSSDMLECPSCGAKVCMIMPTQQPIMQHYEEGFAARIESVNLHVGHMH